MLKILLILFIVVAIYQIMAFLLIKGLKLLAWIGIMILMVLFVATLPYSLVPMVAYYVYRGFVRIIEWFKIILKENAFSSKPCPSQIEYQKALDSVIGRNTFKGAYVYDDIPLGRANLFLKSFDTDIFREDILIYLPQRPLNKDEFKECGYAVTEKGIYYITENVLVDKTISEKKGSIPFCGLYPYGTCLRRMESKNIVMLSILPGGLRSLLLEVANSCIPLMQYKHSKAGMAENAAKGQLPENIKVEDVLQQSALAGMVLSAGINNADIIREGGVDNKFHTPQGHGLAAEYANNTVDQFLGKDAKIVGGNNAKNGPDRLVDGVQIQTKYYSGGKESISAAFENHEARYLASDNKMMPIEVPKGQKQGALEEMKKRIAGHEVPGENNPDNAYKYVKEGYWTYSQSLMIAKSGTVESLAVDSLQGVVIGAQAGSMTFLLSYAYAVWNGQDGSKAFEIAVQSSICTIGKAATVYVLTAQMSRQATILGTNPIVPIADHIAHQIQNSSISRSALGQNLGLNKLNKTNVIGGAATLAIMSGPDIARMLTGRISGKQLFKNLTVAGSTMGAGAIGQTLIPIPVVGALIGGAIGGMLAKSIMDGFVEDDCVEMVQILKEEFMDLVGLEPLSGMEFNTLSDSIFGNSDLAHRLRDMFSSNDRRGYARYQIVEPCLCSIIGQREHINEFKIDENTSIALC